MFSSLLTVGREQGLEAREYHGASFCLVNRFEGFEWPERQLESMLVVLFRVREHAVVVVVSSVVSCRRCRGSRLKSGLDFEWRH